MPIGAYIITPTLEVKKVPFKEWCVFMETVDNRIGQTQIGICLVSTIFLGLDTSPFERQPTIFETMIFPRMPDAETGFAYTQRKWSTVAEAQAGHVAAVEMVRLALPDAEVKQLSVNTGHIFPERVAKAEAIKVAFQRLKGTFPRFDEL